MKYNTSLVTISQKIINKNKIKKISELPILKEAKNLILEGEVVAFPTETVYGLGADAGNSNAVKKIFKAKGRPQDNPLIVHISNLEQFDRISNNEVDEDLYNILNEFWPGPLTVILPKSKVIADQTTAGLKTVGIRMPSHPVALALIEATNTPLAAPSANTSGLPSPTRAEHVYDDLSGKIPLILDGGASEVGVESTIIKVEKNEIKILRPGGISREELEKVSIRKIVSKANKNSQLATDTPLAPGMKYKHYSPCTKVLLYNGDNKELKNFFSKEKDKKIALVFTTETIEKIKKSDNIEIDKNMKIIEIGSLKQMEKIAYRIFYILRELDKSEYQLIIIEKIPEKGIGEAIMNRLYKAASGKI